jgi:hypothetical protein
MIGFSGARSGAAFLTAVSSIPTPFQWMPEDSLSGRLDTVFRKLFE